MANEFLKEYLASSAWQQMQELINEVLETPILWVMDNSGEILLNLDQRYPEFCRIVRSNHKGLRACEESREVSIGEAKKNQCAIVSDCRCGLISYVLPLVLDKEIIGFAGGCHQMFGSIPTEKKIDDISSLSGVNANELKKYIKRIKVISLNERKRLTDILTMFVGTSSLLMKWMNRLYISLDWERNYAAKIMALNEIFMIASSELNWNDMLTVIIGRSRKLLDVDACAIYIYDQDRRELVLGGADGFIDKAVEHRIKIGEGITGQVAETHLAIGIDDIETEEKYYKSNHLKPYRAILSMPLMAQDRLIGVVDIYSINPRTWNQTDIGFLSLIAAQVPGIIEKSKFQMEVSKELEVARYIQAKLIPQFAPIIDGFDISALTIPSKEVSGDYYDFMNIDDETLGIVIADVSGKGIGASILMANARGLIHAYASSETSISNVISKMNDAFYCSTESDKFMTMFCGVLDIKSGILTYTNAGHNPPFLYRNTGEYERLEVGGIVLGIMRNMDYSEGKIQLCENDFIVLYSDGLTEAYNLDGKMFGEDGLHQSVSNYISNYNGNISAQSLLDNIYNDVQVFSSGVPFGDDLTLVVLVCKQRTRD